MAIDLKKETQNSGKNIGWSDFVSDYLDDLLGWKEIEEEKVFASPEEYHEFFGDDIYNSEETGYEIDANKIRAIQRINSKGFQIIEINPRLLNEDDFRCLLPIDELLETIGESSFIGQNPTSIFRSVEIPIVGNNLLVEFAQPKIGSTFTNNLNQANENTTSYFNNYSFLNFGDTQGKAFKLKHGDRFETEFNNVIFTFSSNSPKIRIIVGYNSKYITKDHQSESLALGNFASLQNNHNRLTFQPFNISNFTSSNDPSSWTINDGNSIIYNLIDLNQNNATYAFGHVWITGVHLDLYLNSASAAGSRVPYSFSIVTYAPGFGNAVIKTLYSFQTSIIVPSGGQDVIRNAHITFSEPIRATLSNSTNLGIRQIASSDGALDVSQVTPFFSIQGYSYGQLKYRIASTLLPYTFQFQLDQNPYAEDLEQGVGL